jgi:hypothetical protein
MSFRVVRYEAFLKAWQRISRRSVRGRSDAACGAAIPLPSISCSPWRSTGPSASARTSLRTTEREAVRDHGLTARIAIGDDVRRLQELGVFEPTDGAAVLICLQHPLTEGRLVNPSQSHGRDI